MGVHPGQVLTPLQQLYVEFALSTNARGVAAVSVIEEFRRVRGARCLDVGCAYGGFLVALGWRGARELVGIDLDARWLGLARLNLADHGVEAAVEVADIHDEAIVERLGRFDIVVCNDVLEHVRDLPAAIRNLCRLTAPGGLLYAAIPNKNCARYLLQDSHYHIQGLTLLGHRDAEAYHAAVSAAPGTAPVGYDVSSYRPLRYSLGHLRRHGLTVEVVTRGSGVRDLHHLARDFREVARRFEGFRPAGAPPELVAKISRRFGALHRTFLAMMARYGEAREAGDPVAAEIGEAILRRFGMDTWCLVARRP
jgi:SAM-dependent methyltransferase